MSRIPLTTTQQRILRRVFADAIAYQDSLLATYYTEVDPEDVTRMRVPRALQQDARAVRAEIARYRKLQRLLAAEGGVA